MLRAYKVVARGALPGGPMTSVFQAPRVLQPAAFTVYRPLSEKLDDKKDENKSPSNEDRARELAASTSDRLKKLFQEHGKVAVGIHLSVYAMTLGTFYVTIKNGVDIAKLIESWGLQDYLGRFKPEKGSGALVAAVVATKFTSPLRVPVTLATTPLVSRILRGRNAANEAEQKASQEHEDKDGGTPAAKSN